MLPIQVSLGVSGLEPQIEYYDFDNPSDQETLDLNISNGCSLLSFWPITEKEFKDAKGKSH